MAGKVNLISAHRRSERKMPLLGDCYEKNLFAGYCRKCTENAPYIKYLELALIRPRCGIFHETDDRAFQPSECHGNSKRTNKSSDGFLSPGSPFHAAQHTAQMDIGADPTFPSTALTGQQALLLLLFHFIFFLEQYLRSYF